MVVNCTNELKEVGPFLFDDTTRVQQSILRRIIPFFTPEIVSDLLVPLVNQESKISLRALDWLVTNYAKKNNIVCQTKDNQIFNIHHGYKVALSHFRRRNFDPFRRRARLRVQLNGEVVCDSTVGQCNFLHWSHTNGVLKYAMDNVTQIEADMNRASATHKAEKRANILKGVLARRHELSCAPTAKCLVYEIDTFVKFSIMGGDAVESKFDTGDASNDAVDSDEEV